jgi:1-aminocyclopropane-1-carboxylate deaminase/D-cysteine desulfhydrase-like pyridoxal-dependent ACC family enzyme
MTARSDRSPAGPMALPRESFLWGPTPLHPAAGLERALQLRRPLWVKRDDLTGPGLGGNKVRKLEYLLADARRVGADTVVTVGAAQSNHARLAAILGRVSGFEVHLVLGGETGQGVSGNRLLDELAGATIHDVASTDWDVLGEALRHTTKELEASGRQPYAIPMGGSTPIGAVGYAAAYLELLTQLDRAGVSAEWVVHASSTGGTQAGLLAGRALAGRGPRVFGVDVAKGGAELGDAVLSMGNETLVRCGSKPALTTEDVVTSDFTGPAYGTPTPEALAALRTALRVEALVLDPVYSAKGLAAIPRLDASGALAGTGPIVFLHTGGQPALFAADYVHAMKGAMV